MFNQNMGIEGNVGSPAYEAQVGAITRKFWAERIGEMGITGVEISETVGYNTEPERERDEPQPS